MNLFTIFRTIYLDHNTHYTSSVRYIFALQLRCKTSGCSTYESLLPQAKRELLKCGLSRNDFTEFLIQQFMQCRVCVLVDPMAGTGPIRRRYVIESLWATERRAEPDLFIWRLLINHVGAVRVSQIHRQHSILKFESGNSVSK